MIPPAPLTSRIWWIIPLVAAGFLVWSCGQRMQRVDYVTHVVSGEAIVADASPTGYAGGVRDLIVPEQNNDSCRWIMQTQQMLAQGEWRVRRIDYENAPLGRGVFTPSPYRWWLGLIAWLDHVVSGRSLGGSVEHAALYADPLIQLLLFAIAVIFTARRFGALPASLLSLGLAGLYPFAAGFLPGLPDDKTLARAGGLLSVLVLLAGARTAGPARRWFVGAGVMGGFALWVSAADQVPVVLGIALGAGGALWLQARDGAAVPTGAGSAANWLVWAQGGAMSSLAFYLLEYFPDHLGAWRLRENHPLYGLAWLGLGAALWVLSARARGEGPMRQPRFILAMIFAVAALAAVPVLMWQSGDAGLLAREGWTFKLTRLAGGAEATSLWAWLVRDGFSGMACATLLPALIIVPAVWLLRRQGTATAVRSLLAIALGPVSVVLGFACGQIGRWGSGGVVLLALLVAVTLAWRETIPSRFGQRIWLAGFGLLLIPGYFQLWPSGGKASEVPLNESELAGLIARDLAHTLAKRTGRDKIVVLAPPSETTALSYYGGLPGIGTLDWENQTAIGAAAKIFSATTPQEAFARIRSREVTHIIVPSWDHALDEYVRLNVVQVDDAFLSGLRNWVPLPWLRPVPYQLPAVPGYENQSVAIFEITDEQPEATVLSWQAVYFAEMGRLDYAAAISQTLWRFPNDPAALIARGQVALARQDAAGLGEAVKALVPRLGEGADRHWPWDQRVSLAAVLAQGRQPDLAREQVSRCLAEANERRLRSLSGASLYRLLALAKLFRLELGDPAQRDLARTLLPPEWRSRL